VYLSIYCVFPICSYSFFISD